MIKLSVKSTVACVALVRPEPPFPLLLTETPVTQAEQTVKADLRICFRSKKS